MTDDMTKALAARRRREGVWRGALIAAQLFAVIFMLGYGVLLGVAHSGSWYDDNGYHTPVAVAVLKHANPYFLDRHESYIGFWFPNGIEAFVALLLGATGTIHAANWSGFLFLGLTAFLIFKFARLFTSELEVSLGCVVLTLSVPLLLAQTTAFYNDLHLAFFYLLFFYLLAKAVLTRKAEPAWLALAALILCAGIKYNALALDAILIPAFLYALIHAEDRKPSSRAVALLVATTLFVSGFYVRNWVWRGNPVFPIGLPRVVQRIVSLGGLFRYSEMPDIFNSPRTTFPHPFLPQSLTSDMRPDMTDDGFGVAFVVAEALTLGSLFLLRDMKPGLRRVWVFLLLCCGGALVLFPFHHQVPRYVLFVPMVLGLSPALVCTALKESCDARGARFGAAAVHALILGACAVFIYFNLLSSRASLHTRANLVLRAVASGKKCRIENYDYVRQGHLRIGYVSGFNNFGFNNFVGLLYDRRFTNTLIPLHYANCPFHFDYPRFASEQEFVRYVRGLNLDYIHIFGRDRVETRLLATAFPEKVKELTAYSVELFKAQRDDCFSKDP